MKLIKDDKKNRIRKKTLNQMIVYKFQILMNLTAAKMTKIKS